MSPAVKWVECGGNDACHFQGLNPKKYYVWFPTFLLFPHWLNGGDLVDDSETLEDNNALWLKGLGAWMLLWSRGPPLQHIPPTCIKLWCEQ